jgi:hypothetical protein
MTIEPDAAPLAFITIDDAIAVLRERGFRLSASRRLVPEALFAADADEKPVCLTESFDEVGHDDDLGFGRTPRD